MYNAQEIVSIVTDTSRPVRKHCNADAFFLAMLRCFQQVPDSRDPGKIEIPMHDALMSAFAMFSLKDPSLLAFDMRRREEPENLHTVYGIGTIPCDSQMRDILDTCEPESLRPGFREVFRTLQRGKDLEPMTVLGGHYLLSGDGTGFYYSSKVGSEYCLKKKSGKGQTYHQQMYAAAFVHPDRREVIPLCPEMITRQDGSDKQDCERNAAARFFREFRREHPHLKVIVTEDGLSSNAPHVRDLKELDLRFILGVKPGDHQFLFDQVDAAVEASSISWFTMADPKNPAKTDHAFRFINGVALNKSNPDLLVNVLEYWQVDRNGKEMRFAWITDLEITEENAYEIMRAGRARWRIENETFNTLKNQGYHLGHNYGLGKKHLSAVFTILMMLAFLVDQAQQLGCWLFREAWKKAETKRSLWEQMRSLFHQFPLESMETMLRAIAFGIQGYVVAVDEDTPSG
ncbi:MAG: transposase [Desulfuromonas sp.]|nr:MAG: transposase [Desulfuromonas sp.]